MRRNSAAEVANINARSAMKITATRHTKLNALMELVDAGHALERGTLDFFGESERARGFRAGVADAIDD